MITWVYLFVCLFLCLCVLFFYSSILSPILPFSPVTSDTHTHTHSNKSMLANTFRFSSRQNSFLRLLFFLSPAIFFLKLLSLNFFVRYFSFFFVCVSTIVITLFLFFIILHTTHMQEFSSFSFLFLLFVSMLFWPNTHTYLKFTVWLKCAREKQCNNRKKKSKSTIKQRKITLK